VVSNLRQHGGSLDHRTLRRPHGSPLSDHLRPTGRFRRDVPGTFVRRVAHGLIGAEELLLQTG
jgi:hypothetical protein